MFFRPLDCGLCRDGRRLHRRLWLTSQLPQGLPFFSGKLAVPEALKFGQRNSLNFTAALRLRDLRAQFLQIAVRQFGFFLQHLFDAGINFIVPFGETRLQFTGHAFDFKIAARLVFNLVAELPQVAGEFVVINIFGKFPRLQHFII